MAAHGANRRRRGDLPSADLLSAGRLDTMITHVKFVGIPTADQQRALAFYTEKLGFAVLTDQPFSEKQRWIELAVGRSETRVVLFTPDGHEDRVGTFFNGSLACDDVERTYEELKARGVEFVAPPTKQPWGTYAAFKDPDGNQFVLSSR
jgi:predicted enzyme related to lactoylglutathione lyase